VSRLRPGPRRSGSGDPATHRPAGRAAERRADGGVEGSTARPRDRQMQLRVKGTQRTAAILPVAQAAEVPPADAVTVLVAGAASAAEPLSDTSATPRPSRTIARPRPRRRPRRSAGFPAAHRSRTAGASPPAGTSGRTRDGARGNPTGGERNGVGRSRVFCSPAPGDAPAATIRRSRSRARFLFTG